MARSIAALQTTQADRWANLVAAAEFYILFNGHRPARGFYLLIHDDRRWNVDQPDPRERFLSNIAQCCAKWRSPRRKTDDYYKHVLTLEHCCHTLRVAENLRIARMLADEMRAGHDEREISKHVKVLMAKEAVAARVANSANRKPSGSGDKGSAAD